MRFVRSLFLATGVATVTAWSGSSSSVSRRQAFAKASQAVTASVVAATVGVGSLLVVRPDSAHAASGAGLNEPRIITRMGGLLESFQDGPRGIRMMTPTGWNKFEGEVGAYDLKWQDLVDPTENIKISSTPVKSTTESVAVLGDVAAVGRSLAEKRKAKLLSATERFTEGITFYTFDFALPDNTHQLLMLCVCKGKLWSVDASAKEKRWSKREELYKNVLGSFVPKLA